MRTCHEKGVVWKEFRFGVVVDLQTPCTVTVFVYAHILYKIGHHGRINRGSISSERWLERTWSIPWVKQVATANPTSYYDPVNTDAPTRRYDRERCTNAHLLACTHPLHHRRATLGAGSSPTIPNVSAYSPEPPTVPSTYPKLEYRPSTPQSTAQPEMIDVVKTGITDDNSPDSLHDR